MEGKTRPTWYPVKPGELGFTPIALKQGNTVIKVIPANQLKPGQTGWLAIDLPEGPAKPMTLDAALAQFEGCCL